MATQSSTAETQYMPRCRQTRLRCALFALACVLFAALPALVPSLAYQLTIIIGTALAGLGVALLLRAGLISFGHGLYYAVGAYAVAVFSAHLQVGMLGLMVLAALVAGVVALLGGLFVVRYRGIFFAMLNLALSMVAYAILLKFYGLTGGSDGMSVAMTSLAGWSPSGVGFERALFYVSLVVALLLGMAVRRYLQAPCGWALTAVRDREIRVEYLGRSVRGVLLTAYVLSGVLAGFGGAIVALAVGHVTPDLAYWVTSAEFLVIAVLGGVGHVLGAFVGATLYQLLSVTAAQYLTYTWGMLLGVVILVIIRFAPTGLWGIYDGLWRRANK